MDRAERAKAHAALGDSKRLLIVDQLSSSDRTVAELAELSGMPGNLLAHHLDVLESAKLIERRISEGDHRRRYIMLRRDGMPSEFQQLAPLTGGILFVCTHNSARSQFAAAMWSKRTGISADSAGSHPSTVVHPKAVLVAAEHGVDISGAVPSGYEQLTETPNLVVSVCDRALESGVPAASHHFHWSVPDPVANGSLGAFRQAFSEIAERVDRLASRVGTP